MYHVNNIGRITPCQKDSIEECPLHRLDHFPTREEAEYALENGSDARVDHTAGNQRDRVLDLNHNSEGERLRISSDPKYFVKNMKQLITKVADGRKPGYLDGARITTEMDSWGFNTTYTIEAEYVHSGKRWIISWKSFSGDKRFRFPVVRLEIEYDEVKRELEQEIFESLAGKHFNDEITDKKLEFAAKDSDTIFTAINYVREALRKEIDASNKDYLFNHLVVGDGRIYTGNVSYYTWIDGKDIQRLLGVVPWVYGEPIDVNIRVCDESQKRRHTYWGLRHTRNEWFFDSFNEDGTIKSEPVESPDDAYQKVSLFIQKNQKKRGERVEKAEWARNFVIDVDEGIRNYNEAMIRRVESNKKRDEEKRIQEEKKLKNKMKKFVKNILK